MARSLEDRSKALEEATEIFWRKGYDEASIEDVVRATGFNRYALYNEFGGKRDLFLAALDKYQSKGRSIFVSRLEDPDTSPMQAIEAVFDWAISEMAARKSGCLMCNIASEVAREDPIVAERVDEYLTEIENAQTQALTQARASGELNPLITPKAGAKVLMTMKLGLGARARAGAKKTELKHIVSALMAVFKNGHQNGYQ